LGVGAIAQKLGSDDLALTFFSKVIEIDRNCEEAFFKRGQVHFASSNFDQAIADFTSTLQINPTNLKALNSRGIANSHASHFSHALKDFGKAIQICSSNADLFYNRGLVHWNQRNYAAAISDYTCAIELRPKYYQAFNNRGSAYRELANFEMALADFETSTNLKSDFADGYWNQSLIHLMNGEYQKAWPLYEHRWKSKHFPSEKRNFNEPLWLGNQSIDRKKILIHSEQGLGDTIQFCRYLKLLIQKKCEIFIEVEKPLVSILRCLLPQENIFQKGCALPKFDFHCPLLSLPLAFNTTFETIPFSSAYLHPNQDRVDWWRKFLNSKEKLKIGLAWRGNPNHPKNAQRSANLHDLINELSGDFEWFSLQIETSQEEDQLISKHENFHHFGKKIGDFAETAAFCCSLDAIISVDTSIAHLSGALGLPTYIMLSEVPDSRWQLKGERTPWYDTVKLFRVARNQNYSELLKKIQIDFAR
jgi:lipoprotein NlpI